jgi:hypothetical protein
MVSGRGATVARIRYIKPQFFEDTTIADLSVEARLLYVGLWCYMDKQGIASDDPKLIKRNIFPYDDLISIGRIDQLLGELIQCKRLEEREFDGKRYLFCPSFIKNQKFHRDEKPLYPHEVASVGYQHGASTVPARLVTGNCELVTGNGQRATVNIEPVPNAGQHGASTVPARLVTGNCELVTGNGQRATVNIEPVPNAGQPAAVTPEFDFESLYRKYGRKEGKAEGIKRCVAQIKTQDQYDALSKAIDRYVEHCKKTDQYLKHFDSFLGSKKSQPWKDWLEADTGQTVLPLQATPQSFAQKREQSNLGVLAAYKKRIGAVE